MDKKVREIIEFAIDNEIETYEFYKEAVKKVSDSYLVKTFENLADEELEHKEFLKDFLNSDKNELTLSKPTDYHIAETVDAPKLTTDMTFKEAIQLAMKKEEESMEMYKHLSEKAEDEESKNIFRELVTMEEMHKVKLEKIYLNIAYAEAW